MKQHKETFRQPADDGIPAHWVVQYYDSEDGSGFPITEYFSTAQEATEFEKSLVND